MMPKIPFSLRLVRKSPQWLKGILGLRNENPLHGEARWMEGKEAKEVFKPTAQGLVIGQGRLEAKVSYQHFLAFGPTGIGKTTILGIPNVLLCTGSLVTTDVSGDIYRATSGHLAERGYAVKVLNLSNAERSENFNPFLRADTPQKRRQKISTLAMSKSSPNEMFWTDGAVRVMTMGIEVLVGMKDSTKLNCESLRWLVNRIGVGDKETDDLIRKYADQKTFEEYEGLIAEDEKTRQGYISTAKSALAIWQDDELCSMTREDTMELEEMRNRKTAYFIIVPEDQVGYFSPIINLFYQECFDVAKAKVKEIQEQFETDYENLITKYEIMKYEGFDELEQKCVVRYKKFQQTYNSLRLEKEARINRLLPLYFFMDEFGNIGKLDGFSRTANTIRKYKCSLTLILQAKSQIEATYGTVEAQSIMEAMVSKLYMAGMGLEMCEYVQRILGTTTLYDTEFGGYSEYGRTVGVPLLRSDEIRMLPRNKSILISGRERPALVETLPFYEVPELKAMTEKYPCPMKRGD